MPDPRTYVRKHKWISGLLVLSLVGLCVAGYFLKPVEGPPRDLTLKADPERGAYLIRLGGCVSCHTDKAHGGAMMAGGAPLVSKFGTFYPPNITPDKETGIGDWSLAQFSDALSNGDSPHGNLYPLFPYDNFTLMSDQDVVDLHAGIMALPPISHATPPNDVLFPLNFRFLVSGWKNLFFTPHRFEELPSRTPGWNRGAYLANGPGHCVACHSPHNALGAVVADKAFEGNPVEGTGGKAPPLTAAVLISEGYDRELLAKTLETGETPSAGKVGDEMAEVVRDETSHWNAADLDAIGEYLLSATSSP